MKSLPAERYRPSQLDPTKLVPVASASPYFKPRREKRKAPLRMA
jgi:hypothetical protein